MSVEAVSPYIALVAAVIIALSGSLIYVLGLLAVGWSIYWNITKNAATTLYTVSLIPKTVVVGQGIRLFGTTSVIYGFVFGCIWLLQASASALRSSAPFVIYLVIFGLAVGTLSLILKRADFSLFKFVSPISLGPPLHTRTVTRLLEYAYVFLFFATALIGWMSVKEAITVEEFAVPPRIVVTWEPLFVGIGLYIAASFFTGVPIIMRIDPPLPTVIISRTKETMVGKLVVHSSGVWHFFDTKGALTSVPDSTLDVVRVLPPKALSKLLLDKALIRLTDEKRKTISKGFEDLAKSSHLNQMKGWV